MTTMSLPASTLDEEPFVVDAPAPGRDADNESICSSDEDNDEVSVKKRFEEIKLNLRKNGLDLRNATQLEKFADQNATYLGETTAEDDNTILHLLVEDARDKVFDKYQPLVKLLIDRYPHILKKKDSSDKTALYSAIAKKRDKLVRFMCDTYRNIDVILRIACYRSENCLHLAIRKSLAPDLAVFLINHAGEEALYAQDDKGNTPLHLAVAYDRCTTAQLEVVESLIKRCDKAMDKRTKEPNCFSPYRWHEHTRAEAKRTAEAEAKKAAKEKEIDSTKGRKGEGGIIGGDGPEGKEGLSVKLNFATQTKDLKAQERLMDPLGHQGMPISLEMEKNEPLSPVDVSEAPSKKYWSAIGSHGGYKSAAFGLGSGEPSTSGLNTPLVRRQTGSGAGKLLSPKQPLVPKKIKKKEKEKEAGKVTEESADAIRTFLKLHCIRTKDHDDAVDFLYGRNQGMSVLLKENSPRE
jgi:hypothetical protein